MSQRDPELERLARVLYEARLREAWGSDWERRSLWPKHWRGFESVAEIDLAFAQARAAWRAFPALGGNAEAPVSRHREGSVGAAVEAR